MARSRGPSQATGEAVVLGVGSDRLIYLQEEDPSGCCKENGTGTEGGVEVSP